MTNYQEPKHLSDLLLVEVKSGWTRDRGMFERSAASYPLGTVLARVGNKYVRYAPATAKTAPAIAVAAEVVDAADADTRGVVIARGATLATDELVWPDGITDPERAAAIASLATLGIILRQPV